MIIQRCKNGFSLIELLVAMAASSILMAGIYSFYFAQMKSNRTQQSVVQMQQNMRAGMYLLEREIRMAGYSATNPSAIAGFVQNFATFGGSHAGSGATTDANNVAFTVDSNDSGVIDTGAPLAAFELIAFRHNAVNDTLERWDGASGQWQVAAEQISSLSFTYYREDDSQIPLPLNALAMADIRSIEVAIEATADDRTMSHTNKIKCRNMGY